MVWQIFARGQTQLGFQRGIFESAPLMPNVNRCRYWLYVHHVWWFHDLLNWHTISFTDIAAIFINHFEPFLWYAEEPCITRWVLGMRAWISLIRAIDKISSVGGRVNLYAPWLVPTAIARASTWVSLTNCSASSALVNSCEWSSLPSALRHLFASHTCFKTTQNANFTFYWYTTSMREFYHFTRHCHIIIIVCRVLPSLLTSHPSSLMKTQLDWTLANLWASSMVLRTNHWDMATFKWQTK